MQRSEPHTPDHVKEGKTLPQQIDGDHAYRDEPPEHDPSMWATHELQCVACESTFPDAPAGERRDRLDAGLIDTAECPNCERRVPAIDPSQTSLPSPSSGWDDVVHVVSKVTHDDYGGTNFHPVASYRDKEQAEDVAETKAGDPFVTTQVDCVGVRY